MWCQYSERDQKIILDARPISLTSIVSKDNRKQKHWYCPFPVKSKHETMYVNFKKDFTFLCSQRQVDMLKTRFLGKSPAAGISVTGTSLESVTI